VTPPFVLLADDAGVAAAAELVEARLRREGWRIIDGLDTRPALDRVVLRGVVATARDAAAALLAALDGYGLCVRMSAEPAVRHRLEDDLRRLGPVETGWPGSVPEAAPVLDPVGRAILGLLAGGHSLGEAARLLGLSRRTADRRLADARAALGVTRTTEAIARAARGGWLAPAMRADGWRPTKRPDGAARRGQPPARRT
jgi:DNA-binding CsgD family transcriptional regulator